MKPLRVALGLRAINAANPAPSCYLELAQAAERWGYDAIWAPEIRATDPFGLLGWIGSHTTRIGLGCSVAQVTARGPVSMAAAAVTLDGLSGGRFRLGLGVSGPQIVEGWHGRRYQKPLSHVREYVQVVRQALSGEPVCFQGREFALPVPHGEASVPPLALPTPPSGMPVHLAGLGPKSVALAGELADGWIAIHCPPSYMAAARPWLAQGARRSGRSLENFTTSVMVICSVEDDQDLAWDLARPTIAVYLGGMGSRTTNFYYQLAVRLGFGPNAAAVRQAYLAGDVGEAIAAVGDELVDAMAVCGPPARVQARLAAYREAGVDSVIVGLAAPSARAQLEQLAVVGGLARDLPAS